MTRRAGSFSFAEQESNRRRSPLRWLLVLLLLGIAGLAGWWYLNPTSQPAFLADLMPVHGPAETTLYRWQDDQGQWVISDTPPPAGTVYERVDLRQDTNVLPPIEADNED